MLARIAQELFWLGRDLTRAEHTARMLDGAFHAEVAGGPSVGSARGMALSWSGVLAVIGAKPPAPGEETPAELPEGASVPTLRTADRFEIAPLLTLDTENPASVVSCVYRARERARTLRDVISTEMWEALNAFYLSLGRYDLEAALATGPYSLYQEVKERCSLFWGLLEKTMLRDEARAFLDAGGRIDEADMVLRMLRVSVPAAGADALAGDALGTGTLGSGTLAVSALAVSAEPPDPEQVEVQQRQEAEAIALLHAVGGIQAFRRHLRQAPTLYNVGRFLLYESAYPGSVVSSLAELRDDLELADPQPRYAHPVLRLGRLIADLELQQRSAVHGGPLLALLVRTQEELEVIDQEIFDRYFADAAVATVHT